MKIRTHILILVVTAVLPIFAFAVIAMVTSWRREEATIQESLFKGARAMSLALDRELSGDIRSLQILAESPALEAGDLRGFYEQAGRVLSAQTSWSNIVLTDAGGGRQMLNLRYSFGQALPENELDPEIMAAIASSRGPFIAPLGKSIGEHRTAVLLPVKSTGNRQYNLIAILKQERWLHLLSSYGVPAGATMTLIDQNGIIVVRTLNNQKWIGKPPSPSLSKHIRAAPEGSTVTTGLEGQLFYTAYSKSPLSNWTVAIGLPTESIQLALWRSSSLLVTGGLSVAALACMLALLFGSRIARAVASLAQYTRSLELQEPLTIKPSVKIAEVDYVSSTFNEAVQKLQQRDAELRLSEERFRSLINATTSIVWFLAANGRCVAPQPSWELYTGQKWQDYRGFGWANVIHPDDRRRVRELWLQARAAASSYSAGGRLWHAASNAYRHFESRAVPVSNSAGEIREWIGMCVDIEDRKQAEAALMESEERFRTLADSSPVPLWVTDSNGLLAFTNAAYREFFATPVDGTQAHSWQGLLHAEDATSYLGAFHQAIRETKAFRAEARVRRRDGQWSWVDTRALPRFSRDGRFLGHVGSSPDVSESKLLEEQLREADRRKDRFLAMLGHELRNPLGVASSYVQLLKTTAAPEPERQQFQSIIERQIKHMARLVDDLLEVSRISRGQVRLDKAPCDFASIVRQTAEDYRPTFESAALAFTVNVPPQQVWITADGTRLAQSIGNLLHNAAKFTGSGGQVAIQMMSSPDKRCVVLSVSDSGSGMTPDMVSRLFDSFSQAEQTLDRSKGGLGLGLYLVKQVVELHGGRVWASSEGLELGSEFSIELPLEPAPASVAKPGASDLSRKTSRRVLVIDDNRPAARALELFLKNTGHAVETAYDGAAGLCAARRFKPDVVLCDIGLPELDGYAVAQQIRRDSSLRGVYLIAISGYGQDEDRQRARGAGFDEYLVKPVNLAEVEKSVRQSP
jgi:PAS domain S-box-containing protein